MFWRRIRRLNIRRSFHHHHHRGRCHRNIVFVCSVAPSAQVVPSNLIDRRHHVTGNFLGRMTLPESKVSWSACQSPSCCFAATQPFTDQTKRPQCKVCRLVSLLARFRRNVARPEARDFRPSRFAERWAYRCSVLVRLFVWHANQTELGIESKLMSWWRWLLLLLLLLMSSTLNTSTRLTTTTTTM